MPGRVRPRKLLRLAMLLSCNNDRIATPSSAFLFLAFLNIDANRALKRSLLIFADASHGTITRNRDDRTHFRQLAQGQVQVPPTDGARLVGREPKIDALLMEHVVANRQEAEDALVLELRQANGALQAVLLLPEVLDGRVHEGREGLYERRVEAIAGPGRTPLVPRGALPQVPGAEQVLEEAPAEEDGEEADEEEDEEDDGEDDGDGRGCVGRL